MWSLMDVIGQTKWNYLFFYFPLPHQNPLPSHRISLQLPGFQLFVTSSSQKYGIAWFSNETISKMTLFPLQGMSWLFHKGSKWKKYHSLSWDVVYGKASGKVLFCLGPSGARDHFLQLSSFWNKHSPRTNNKQTNKKKDEYNNFESGLLQEKFNNHCRIKCIMPYNLPS